MKHFGYDMLDKEEGNSSEVAKILAKRFLGAVNSDLEIYPELKALGRVKEWELDLIGVDVYDEGSINSYHTMPESFKRNS